MSHTTYRNRHNREEHHFGTLDATLVELGEALGVDLPAGATLEAALSAINSRITRLENADVYVYTLKLDALLRARGFSADAILKAILSDGIPADAVLRAAINGSFTSDAALLASISASLTSDAWVAAGAATGSFGADAILLVTQTANLPANAWLISLGTGSVLADAIVLAPISGSLDADAVLTDGTPLGSFLADAIIKSTIAGSVTSDAIKLVTQESGDAGGLIVRFGSLQAVPNVIGSYTQNMDVGMDPSVVGVFVLGWGTGTGEGISTWTFDGGSTLSFEVKAEYIGTRAYLFHNTSPSSMQGTVEVKLQMSQNYGTLNFIPFAIENGGRAMSKIDSDWGTGAGGISNYVLDSGTTPSVGIAGIYGGGTSPAAAMTSVLSSGQDAGYETHAPATGSRNLGFTGSGQHAWVAAGYSTGATSTRPSLWFDAVLLVGRSGSVTADAEVVARHFTADAFIAAYLTADAVIAPRRFTADAVIAPLGFTADAVIAAADESSSTLGEMQLGSTSLGE